MTSLEKKFISAAGISGLGAASSFCAILVYGAILNSQLMAQALFIIGLIELYCSLTNFGITQYIHKHNQAHDSIKFTLCAKILLSVIFLIPTGLYIHNTSILSNVEPLVLTALLLTLFFHGLSRFYADIQETSNSFTSAQLIRATPSVFRLFGAIIIATNSELITLSLIVFLELVPALGSTFYGALKNVEKLNIKNKIKKSSAARYMASFYINDLLFIPVSPSFVRVLASSFLSNESLVILGVIQTFLYPIARFSPVTLMRGTIIRELSNSEHDALRNKSRKISLQTSIFSLASSLIVISGLLIYLHLTQAKITHESIFMALLGCISMWLISSKMLMEIIAQIHEKEAIIIKSSFYSMLSGLLFCTLSIYFDFLWIAVGGLSALIWMLYYKSSTNPSTNDQK